MKLQKLSKVTWPIAKAFNTVHRSKLMKNLNYIDGTREALLLIGCLDYEILRCVYFTHLRTVCANCSVCTSLSPDSPVPKVFIYENRFSEPSVLTVYNLFVRKNYTR